ncbi:hypothetical protein B0F87_10231 [Methylobacter tundripaludum]|uniref:Uncharacterized protein n=1 Tax=Methylobacter tundripaludum TaxID=173365 RepID=A0A2S6HHH4_9GAMM|nr:hypothetical protein [Methylobacter tundripaludum]PPK76927.1 hypothetical protein B0F87_10231 [Methylobacter tundripaludum]
MGAQQIKPKYAPYAKPLADRMKWNNPPQFVFVCVGGDAFRQAQKYNLDRDNSAMVLMPGQDPSSLIWPVKDCLVILKWDGSVPAKLIIELVKCLLRSSAISVTVWPTWEDFNTPTGYYDTTQQPIKFINSREIIRTYYPKQVQA